MTSKFDISKYEIKSEPKKNKGIDFSKYEIKDEEETSESKFRKPLRSIAQYGIGNVERIAAPYDIAVSPLSSKSAQMVPYRESLFSDIERLQEQKQSGQWDEQDQELYDSLIEQIKNPEEAKKHVKTLDISSSKLIEKGSKKLGIDLEPEDVQENIARIGGNLFSPKGLKKGIERGVKYFDKTSREALKTESKWKSLSSLAKKDPEKQNILNFAKNAGLNPEETNLLMQSHGKIEFLEKIAKKSKKFKETAEGLRKKLGQSYEELKHLGRQDGLLTSSEKGALQADLQKTLNKIGETFIEGPDTKSARLGIESSLEKLKESEGTIADLINSRQNLGQLADWKKVDAKGHLLKEAEDSFFKAIERKNPDIAKNLKYTDKAWSKYKKFSKNLDKKQPVFSYHGATLPTGTMGQLAFWGVLNASGLVGTGVGKALLAKEGIQRLGTKLLIDPKYQDIHKKIIESVSKGSTNNQKALFVVLKKMIKKDDPDLYEEISDITVD